MPLLKDEAITRCEELDLESYEPWFGGDARNFTPYTRHDELQRSRSESLTVEWAQQAHDAFLDTTKQDLDSETEIKSVVEIRRDVIQIWLSSKRYLKGLHSQQALLQLRNMFTERMQSLIIDAIGSMQASVCSNTAAVLASWHDRALPPATSLWDPSMLAMELSEGAYDFKRAVMQSRAGYEMRTQKILDLLDVEAGRIAQVPLLLREMRATRWDDDYDSDDENDENTIADQLSKQDPEVLSAVLQSNTAKAIAGIETTIAENVAANIDCSEASSPGIFALRLCRALRERLPRLERDVALTTSTNEAGFCGGLVSTYTLSSYKRLEHRSLPIFRKMLNSYVESKAPVTTLWDGSPPLPLQPGAAPFIFIREVVKGMERLGPDLWSPDLVSRLKISLRQEFADVLNSIDTRLQESSQEVPPSTEHVPIKLNGLHKDVEAQPDETASMAEATQGVEDTHDHADASLDTAAQVSDTEVATPSAELSPKLETNGHTPIVQPKAGVNGGSEEADKSDADVPLKSSSPSLSQTRAREKQLQLLMDALYLSHALSTVSDIPMKSPDTTTNGASLTDLSDGHDAAAAQDTDALHALTESLMARLIIEDEAEPSETSSEQKAKRDWGRAKGKRERLERAAATYWARTYLLFGLLGA
ncbi:hypothetical protein MRB53_037139 [Persea americana]|nr:hypothetical protein MRB53_037139 [Persea americana]